MTDLVLGACGGKKQGRLAHDIVLFAILQESVNSRIIAELKRSFGQVKALTRSVHLLVTLSIGR